MRRIFAAILTVVLIVTMIPGAGAEGFTLRNGIQFGDTMDTILKKETTLTRRDSSSNWFDGKIAGYANDMIPLK